LCIAYTKLNPYEIANPNMKSSAKALKERLDYFCDHELVDM
jgi:hypothetical protein